MWTDRRVGGRIRMISLLWILLLFFVQRTPGNASVFTFRYLTLGKVSDYKHVRKFYITCFVCDGNATK
jgi:hypothetical protein